jgi:DHA2 family multidrug resistance protein-like MFS transporter
VTSVAAGVTFGIVFARRQRRLASPLLDLRLFTNRTFSVALGILLLGGIVMAGVSLMSTMYVQTVHGLSPFAAGLWLIPQNVAMIAGSIGAPRLARRFKPASVIAAGLALSALGVALHTQVGPHGGLPLLIAGMVLASAGISLPMPLGANFVMASTPPEKAGSAASIQETGGEFGVAMGVALLGSLSTFVYRSHLAGAAPAGLSPDAMAAARDSVAAAIATAQHTPGALGEQLAEAARASFTAGLNAVGLAGAVIFAGLAVLALRVLRPARSPEPSPEPSPAVDRELVEVS